MVWMEPFICRWAVGWSGIALRCMAGLVFCGCGSQFSDVWPRPGPPSRLASSLAAPRLTVLRIHLTVFQSSCRISRSHQPCTRVLIFFFQKLSLLTRGCLKKRKKAPPNMMQHSPLAPGTQPVRTCRCEVQAQKGAQVCCPDIHARPEAGLTCCREARRGHLHPPCADLRAVAQRPEESGHIWGPHAGARAAPGGMPHAQLWKGAQPWASRSANSGWTCPSKAAAAAAAARVPSCCWRAGTLSCPLSCGRPRGLADTGSVASGLLQVTTSRDLLPPSRLRPSSKHRHVAGLAGVFILEEKHFPNVIPAYTFKQTYWRKQ